MKTKRVQIVLTIIGIMAFALMMVGCGGDSQGPSHTQYPLGGLQSALDGQPAFQGATHILTGTLSVSNEEQFRLITARDYTGTRTRVPEITLTLKVNAQGVIEQSFMRIVSYDGLGRMKYESACTADQFRGMDMKCGKFSTEIFAMDLRDYPTGYGFIGLVADRIDGQTIEGKASLDNNPMMMGRFELSMQVLGQVLGQDLGKVLGDVPKDEKITP